MVDVEPGENLNGGPFVITDEYAEKFHRFIDYLGPNIYCDNGTGDESLGAKRLPGHNWGGSMCHSAPNIFQLQPDRQLHALPHRLLLETLHRVGSGIQRLLPDLRQAYLHHRGGAPQLCRSSFRARTV